MGFLDKFKKKPVDRHSGKAKAEDKENVLDMVREDQPSAEKKSVKLKDSTGDAYRVLQRATLSEKTNMLAQRGKYVFRVHPLAVKPEIKRAVEKVYDVHVTDVNIVRVKGKDRRYGKATGRTADWKKAIVTLRSGERIEGISETV